MSLYMCVKDRTWKFDIQVHDDACGCRDFIEHAATTQRQLVCTIADLVRSSSVTRNYVGDNSLLDIVDNTVGH
eukprot:6230123-Amphidinium_carterae.1